MTSPEHYLLNFTWPDEVVDIMPIVTEVIETCPYRHDLTVADLVELIRRRVLEEPLPANAADRVEGCGLGEIIGFVFKRVITAHRIKGLQEPETIKAWEKHIELDPWDDVCPAASRMTGRFLRPEELKPLPLRGCWGYNCQCEYSAKNRRTLQRRGRLDEHGDPIPMAPRPVACYIEDHPEEMTKVAQQYKCRTPRQLGTRDVDD